MKNISYLNTLLLKRHNSAYEYLSNDRLFAGKSNEERFLSRAIASSFLNEIRYREDSRVSKRDTFEY